MQQVRTPFPRPHSPHVAQTFCRVFATLSLVFATFSLVFAYALCRVMAFNSAWLDVVESADHGHEVDKAQRAADDMEFASRPPAGDDERVFRIQSEIDKIGQLIGAMLVPSQEKGFLIVGHVYAGKPAYGHLLTDDRITRIGDHYTHSLTRSHVRDIVRRGPADLPQMVQLPLCIECNDNRRFDPLFFQIVLRGLQVKECFLSRPPVPEHAGRASSSSSSSSTSSSSQPRQQPGEIFRMGFPESDVRAALSLCNGDESRAIEHLLSQLQQTTGSGDGHQSEAPPQRGRKFTIHFMREGGFFNTFVVTATTARDLVPLPPVCIMLVVMFPLRLIALQLWSAKVSCCPWSTMPTGVAAGFTSQIQLSWP